MSHNEAAPGAGSAPQVRPAGRFSLSNRRLSTKLVIILLVPVLTAMAFAGLRVQSSYTTWRSAQDAEKVAKLVQSATELAQALDLERDRGMQYLIKGQSNRPEVQQLWHTSELAKANFMALAANAPNVGHVQERIQQAYKELEGLPALRASRYSVPGTTTEEGYAALLSALQALDNELVVGGGSSVNSDARSIYAITLAKDAVSVDRAIVLHILLQPTPTSANAKGYAEQRVKAFGYLFLQSVAQNEFTHAADAGFRQDLDNALADAQAQGQAAVRQAAGAAAAAGKPFVVPLGITDAVPLINSGLLTTSQLAAKGVTAQSWMAETTLEFNAMRSVEQKLTDTAVQQASADATKARNDAVMNAAIALGALLLAGILTALIARSMIRSMRRLRDGAQQIANDRLPDLVRQLSKTDPGRVDLTVAPIPVAGKDEIAEVARAFDDVHREAIRLAAEQALLRGNVNAIFTNLSRRSHGLIERQLALITDLENNEADPDQLENLFKLDHLATRMRRNGENLLVLAGEDAGRSWGEPIPLVDVLRAAASEVEQYERIELAGIPEADVIGPAVTDLVHLLAELLENATTFSSPQTKVRVTATRLPDQRVLVEIHDKGIGLTSEDFAEINAKLADPPTVDASVSRQMGLFVVGRLAERHGVRVQLRPSGESAGTTSLVMMPEQLTQLVRVGEPEEQFTVSRIYPEAAGGQQAASGFGAAGAFGGAGGGNGNAMSRLRTASELGFDDSRYERAAEQPVEQTLALDAVQRSLRLGQRRSQAALEAGPEAADGYAGQGYQEQGFAEQGYQEQNYAPGYGSEYTPEYGAGSDFQQGYAPNAGQDFGAGRPASSYPAPEAGYEPGRYTPQHFEAGVAERQTFTPEYPEDTYLTPASTPGMEHYGTGAPAYEPEPSHGSGPQQPGLGGNDLPTRRPGAALGGGPIGSRAAGEHPNWFTGARETGQPTGSMPVMPSGNGRAAAALPASAPAAQPPREAVGGGTTGAGLPRRVPRQNLLPGQIQDPAEAAQQNMTPQAPQLSRSPEEVRGRLTNLRRGIQQGHNAGDTPHQGSGPYGTNPQER
ncbi:nitrate- and nitrite sensing domain-containing protein [Streptacidiphilus sp. MAP12-20]|uniref:sensor histidine kinase n=1 Tax=Streptacidiphilus sp. MAP12-20 TaxID=3156299 RepID=UPI003515BB55